MLPRVIILAHLLAHSAQGWEILTATLDPPTTPILEGKDVIAKVTCIIKQTTDYIYICYTSENSITYVFLS